MRVQMTQFCGHFGTQVTLQHKFICDYLIIRTFDKHSTFFVFHLRWEFGAGQACCVGPVREGRSGKEHHHHRAGAGSQARWQEGEQVAVTPLVLWSHVFKSAHSSAMSTFWLDVYAHLNLCINCVHEVGILDVDLCGPSIPRMLSVGRPDVHQCDSGWVPVYTDAEKNLALMSIGFLLEDPDEAVVWRGPKKTGVYL